MQRRLDTANEAKANLEAQLAELTSCIEVEKTLRPETVGPSLAQPERSS